jgi:hypothetical protein
MIKMAAFGTVTELILAGVIIFIDSLIKPKPCLCDLFPDLREVGDFKRGSVFLNEFMEIHTIEM